MTDVSSDTLGLRVESKSSGHSGIRRFLRDRIAVAAGVFLLIIVLTAIFAPLVATHNPATQDLMDRFGGWSSEHWLGTDEFGRDIYSRLVYGSRATISAAAIAVGVSLLIGIPTGLIAGYRGGRVDGFLSRIFEGLMSIPGLILALTIVAVLGPGLVNAMVAVGVIFAPQFYRVARAATQEVMGETFIESAIAIGCRPRRVLIAHVGPNVLPAVMVQISVVFGVAVSAEASLSFLGLGVEAPAASWGSMLSSAAKTMTIAPIQVWLPGLLIFAVVLSFTLLGEGLRKVIGGTQSRRADD